MDAALGIVALTNEEADKILRLRREEVELLTSFRILARTEGHDAARRRNAPVPTTTRTGVMHVRSLAAYTYAMEIQRASAPAFKIGWAFDYRTRARQFNQYALPEIGGLSYRVILFELWETAREAFRMEQYLLRSFDTKRHSTNREVIHGISLNELEFAWGESILRLRRKAP